MFDAGNILEEKRLWHQRIAEITVTAFQRRHIDALYVSTRQEALFNVMERIPKGATVGCGDSITLHQVGVLSELRKNKDYLIIDPLERDPDGLPATTGQERLALMRKSMTADVFLTSMNAVTMDGKLVSTDATGNRIAPVIFGPRQVIIIAGVNKIVKNLDEAFQRIKQFVAPLNARRHLIKHNDQRFAELPCVKTGTCSDCSMPERICRYTVIIEGERAPGTLPEYVPRIHVIIVGEELGI